jgi:DNA-binding NarL/FixJ family response regulator
VSECPFRVLSVRTRSHRAGSLFAGPSVTTRILIADDHQSGAARTSAGPGSQSCWEICGDAVDGREAIAKAIELRPDLTILDYAMPRLDGLSAAKEIHKLLPTVPIVLHTLYGSTEVELAANNYGIRRAAGKAQPGALISAVEELLSTEAACATRCGLRRNRRDSGTAH